METFPTDPLEGLEYNFADDAKCGYEDSLFNEPTWIEAANTYNSLRPVIPSSELNIPHSSKKKVLKKEKKRDEINSFCNQSSAGKKTFSMPENKISDPKAAELLKLCRSGWTLSKGQKNKPAIGKIRPVSVDSDIQSFAERYSDAKSKSSAVKGTDLNSIGERFQPQVWPNKDTVSFTRANNPLEQRTQMFRAPDSKKSTLGRSSFSFPKDIRMHPGRKKRREVLSVLYCCW